MKVFFSILAFCFVIIVQAQSASWLEGRWTGDGFGGISEEVWSAPAADGTIMGMFRHMNKDGSINFYELFVLDSTGLRLRHFNPDFTAWEEKEDFLTFKMVAITENKVTLKGLVYELVSPSEMKVSLDMKSEEGIITTKVFTFQRAD